MLTKIGGLVRGPIRGVVGWVEGAFEPYYGWAEWAGWGSAYMEFGR